MRTNFNETSCLMRELLDSEPRVTKPDVFQVRNHNHHSFPSIQTPSWSSNRRSTDVQELPSLKLVVSTHHRRSCNSHIPTSTPRPNQSLHSRKRGLTPTAEPPHPLRRDHLSHSYTKTLHPQRRKRNNNSKKKKTQTSSSQRNTTSPSKTVHENKTHETKGNAPIAPSLQ